MYEYYIAQDAFPTYGSFETKEELHAYEQQRRSIFTDKLYLPARTFANADLIEFGPDTGENSLVFARWGARCTLVEPNKKAHPILYRYFERFKLSSLLTGVIGMDIEAFSQSPHTRIRYDFIDAEGFIYTVRPLSLWMKLFSDLLRPNGFAILFFCETFGSFQELFLKCIFNRYRMLTNMESRTAARNLFKGKWDSIPHKRSIDAWIMDVLENPFVRLRYFLDAQRLCEKMAEYGFSLYSSWPPYKDGLDVYWFKKVKSPDEWLDSQREFIARMRLGHMFSRKLLVLKELSLYESLANLLKATDSLIDVWSGEAVHLCYRVLESLGSLVVSEAVFGPEEAKKSTVAAIRSMQTILRLLDKGAASELVAFCNQDQAFLQSWGTPSHFAVFRKVESSSQALR